MGLEAVPSDGENRKRNGGRRERTRRTERKRGTGTRTLGQKKRHTEQDRDRENKNTDRRQDGMILREREGQAEEQRNNEKGRQDRYKKS